MARPRRDGTPPREPNRRSLSDAFVFSLRPQDRPFSVWDTKQRGLAVTVQPTGSKAWKCVYAFKGRGPRWYHIGSADAIGLADARKLASRVMFAVAEGKDPAAERRAARSSGSFEDLATRYVEEHAKRSNKSWRQADALVRRHLLPRWAKLRAADIKKEDVKTAFHAISAPVVANQTLAAASAIFSWAIREEVGDIKTNPCALVRRNETRSRERVLTDSELRKFWGAFDEAGLVRGAALRMILLTGQRPGEIVAMRREHIADGWWTLPGAPVPSLGWPGTKNGETHRVWLSEPAQRLIEELGETGRVFPGARRLDDAMRTISANAEVGIKVTPHDLRRSCLSRITGLGFGRDAMDRIANHKTREVTDVYDRHGYADEDRKIMEALAASIVSIIEGDDSANVVRGRFNR